MAASMMIAPMGSRLKVTGMRMAVPAAGPSPGKTPIRVPRMHPIKEYNRFTGIVATENP